MPFLSASKNKGSKDEGPDGTVPIPTALGAIPLLGSVPLLDPDTPMASISEMAAKHGEIFRMVIPGRNPQIVCSTQALVNECCDETRFEKTTRGNVLAILREGVQDGIFTANGKDEVWGAAHRILVPAFGPVAIQGMFDDMYDVSAQLALKWARHGPSSQIAATDDLTRMTLDTIALCSMGFRFNSYYHDDLHPFITVMNSWLRQASDRFSRPFPQVMYSIFAPGAEGAWAGNCAALGRTAREVLEARKKNPAERKDLLTAMMEGVDPKTGHKLGEQTIIDNLVTFLIAGHETTSGMLAFAFVELLRSPNAYRKVQEEVDRVVGRERLRLEHIPKLKYISAALKECLRLNPTIPGIGVRPLKDEIIAGKYLVKPSDNLFLVIGNSHLDPVVWGETAKQFIPERMLDENFEPLERKFPNCWKPFGNGMRACIGRAFAWQEAVMAMAILFQNFNFVSHDPNYKLKIKEALTTKPDGFAMRAMLRHGMTPTELEHRLAGGARGVGTTKLTTSPMPQMPTISGVPTPAGAEGMKPMSIYYGSNSGTCEALAHRLAADAAVQGFRAVAIDVLDAANGRLPKTGDHPVVFITASYEGQPPDNAAHFVSWLESLKGDGEMAGVNYAVFGCGHRDWARTFHRVPTLVDTKLAELGGARLAPMGATDAADGNTFLDFETWEFEKFWPALAARYNIQPKDLASALESADVAGSQLTVEVSNPRSTGLRQDVGEAVVTATKLLTAPGAPAKRHVEIQLPSGVSYTAGDYLVVLPLNPTAGVDRAMRRFGLARDAHITIRSGGGHTTLPTGHAVSAHSVLSEYVELAQPATKRGVLALAEAAGADETTKERLLELAGDIYQAEVSARRVSVLDLLERFPSVELPFGAFLALLPPIRVRQYSISSSPLCDGRHATLTYSVVDETAEDGRRHQGIATTYLASLGPGDHVHVAVRPSHAAFHLPADGERTPVVCVAAGSGMAPFRGFVQERAAQLGAGRRLAPMLLFFGCRDPAVDDLYRDELDRWEQLGAVDVRRVYSRAPEANDDEARGLRHVQELLWREAGEVKSLWEAGAKVFVCGGRAAGEAVKHAFFQGVVKGQSEGVELDREEMQEWYETVRSKRYAADVFD
ncbi:hypothetical protein RB601_002045 [Gaeumannomyces tritici]